MNRRANAVETTLLRAKSPIIAAMAAAALLALAATPALAQDDDSASVLIAAPTVWSTLRSDSVVVSIQADTSKLPKKSIDFKVIKRSGVRSTTLFSKNVKVDDVSVDAFLGRVSGLPIGGGDYLSIEWSAPGSDIKGVIEPIGAVRLAGTVSEENKWVPTQPPLSAVKLKEKLTVEEALGLIRQ